MSELYVVVGRTGEYSDKRQWSVGASTDRSTADGMVQKLNDIARRFKALMDKDNVTDDFEEADLLKALREAGDKACENIDYTGVKYKCEAVPMLP